MKTLVQTLGGGISAAALALAITPATGAQNTPPAALPDNSYVTISGTVAEVLDADEFTVNYSGGTIKVDTNDAWPNLFRKEALEMLKPGDRVTITGKVDDNLFARKEIDASSISHQGKTYSRVYSQTPYDTAYYGYWPYYGWDDKMYNDNVSISGTVSRVIDDDEFEMKYGTGTVKVDTSALNVDANRLLQVGDRVMVYGDMDDNWFSKRELDADYLVRTNVYQPAS